MKRGKIYTYTHILYIHTYIMYSYIHMCIYDACIICIYMYICVCVCIYTYNLQVSLRFLCHVLDKKTWAVSFHMRVHVTMCIQFIKFFHHSVKKIIISWASIHTKIWLKVYGFGCSDIEGSLRYE